MALDPNRPHGLDDVLARWRASRGDSNWTTSWADVCRVREYVGEEWTRLRDNHGSDYNLAPLVLSQLDMVDQARAAIAPYVTIDCNAHDAPAGTPCARRDGEFWRAESLPGSPVVCVHRVLAKHDRQEALAIFEREPRTNQRERGGRVVLPISVVPLENARGTARAQYRHPQSFHPERIFVSALSDWTICDLRVADKSVLAPHHDLPGFLFSTHVIGPSLPMPVVDQDQWIEIDVRQRIDFETTAHGKAPGFYASIVGTR